MNVNVPTDAAEAARLLHERQEWFRDQMRDPASAVLFAQEMRKIAPEALRPQVIPVIPVVDPQAAYGGKGARYKSIEEKNYRRMEKYSGAPGTWGEWSFDFVTTTQGISPDVGKVIEEMSRTSEATVTQEAVDRVPGLTAEMKERYGTELFGVLNSLTSGDASLTVRGVIAKLGSRCGFAAYYALNCRFNPKTPARMLQYLLTVTDPPPIKDVRMIPKMIEEWEVKKSVLEKEFSEQLSENLPAAILVYINTTISPLC